MNSHFIATEPLGIRGEKGEKIVWEIVKNEFEGRESLGYWRYPIFAPGSKFRKEPDILIADYELGLVVIEVKAIAIEQIVGIQGHLWQYQNFYTDCGNPYQQAANQLFALLNYSDREPLLKQQISARALIALPYITQEQWQERGFAQLPSNPPIIFKNHLENPLSLIPLIGDSQYLRMGKQLTATQWELLLSVLGGTALYQQPAQKNITKKNNRGYILQQARSRLTQLDLAQETIAKQIPPGMQRIRGVAGSGKTVILCQKAALMHLKYPQWQIAVVFFSRSLYEKITQEIARWIDYFSCHQQQYIPEKSNLKVLHAWGSKSQPGFYSTMCQLTKQRSIPVSETESKEPSEALGEICVQLLETVPIPQVFDAILIDEAQDLLVDKWLYQGKQPFYWLAYQALRAVSPIHPQQKRLIWAYDEFQSLHSLKSPNAGDLFGEDLAHLVSGNYPNGIAKNINLTRCYRTPEQIVNVANSMAMGLLRSGGILTNLNYEEEWLAIGYQVQGKLAVGEPFFVEYQSANGVNFVRKIWQGAMIEFNCYTSRQQELTALAENIKSNLEQENLLANDILILLVGFNREVSFLQLQTAKFLIKQGIRVFIPGSKSDNSLHTSIEESQPNKFWHQGAITISNIYRAKGQEASLVYLIGLDNLAKHESNIYLRNQLFIGLTRSQGWVNLSGIGGYEFYQELEKVIAQGNKFSLVFSNNYQREVSISDRVNLLRSYAKGRRNFCYVNLTKADLANKNLSNINLIAANLAEANLQNTDLSGAKLIEANLTNANLVGANLSGAKLMGANLTGAILTNTNLERAVF